MPDERLKHARGTLPAGYQFGDGVRVTLSTDYEHVDEPGTIQIGDTITVRLPRVRMVHPKGWRPYHDTAAEQLERRASKELSVQVLEALSERGVTANVIEAEEL